MLGRVQSGFMLKKIHFDAQSTALLWSGSNNVPTKSIYLPWQNKVRNEKKLKNQLDFLNQIWSNWELTITNNNMY